MPVDRPSRCFGCFAPASGEGICPHCSYDAGHPGPRLALPVGVVLDDQYVVGRVLGEPGGFGITYLAWDRHLQVRCAIKEFLPRDLVGRAQDHRAVLPHSVSAVEAFREGLRQFIREARTLAGFDHPNLVRVKTCFEAHGTAYLVMPYYEGTTLKAYLRSQGGYLELEEAVGLMQPVLDGLGAVHAKGILHRDVKPGNIYRTAEEGKPILLDFGAARVATAARSRNLSVVLTPGYAPFEQYSSRGQQGPWTDVYACAATLYHMVTGRRPPDAAERAHEDALVPAHVVKPGLPLPVSEALQQALAMDYRARPQSIATFSQLLATEPAPLEHSPSLPAPGPTYRVPRLAPARSEPPAADAVAHTVSEIYSGDGASALLSLEPPSLLPAPQAHAVAPTPASPVRLPYRESAIAAVWLVVAVASTWMAALAWPDWGRGTVEVAGRLFSADGLLSAGVGGLGISLVMGLWRHAGRHETARALYWLAGSLSLWALTTVLMPPTISLRILGAFLYLTGSGVGGLAVLVIGLWFLRRSDHRTLASTVLYLSGCTLAGYVAYIGFYMT